MKFGPKSISAADGEQGNKKEQPAPATKGYEYPAEELDPEDIPF